MNKQAYSVKEAAQYLGLSKAYLDNLRCQRPEDSPPFAKIGHRVVYPVKHLESWLDSRLVRK